MLYNVQNMKNFFSSMPSFFKTNKNFKNKKGDVISKKRIMHYKRELKDSAKLMLK